MPLADLTAVANLALSHLGEPFLTDYATDTGTTADWVRLHLPQCKDTVLEGHVWSFATRCSQLATAPVTETTATGTLDPTGSNNVILLTALAPGPSGDEISLDLSISYALGITVSVSGKAISVLCGEAAATAAAVTLDPSGTNNSVLFTAADELGFDGNSVSVEYLTPPDPTLTLSVGVITAIPAVAASATVTVTGCAHNDTVTVGGVVFTCQASAPLAPRQYLATAASFASAVNAYNHPTVTATGTTLTAREAGTGGNAIALAKTGGAVLSGATLAGGVAVVPLAGPRIQVTPKIFLGNISTTAADVIAAVNAHAAASLLVTASASGTVTGVIDPLAATNLTGGTNRPSTAAEVIAAINADEAAKLLVLAANGSGSDGSGTMAAVAQTYLTGGSSTSTVYAPAYGSAFNLPTDCLRVLKIDTADIDIPRNDFEIQGRYLLLQETTAEAPVIHYITHSPPVDEWPTTFTDAVAFLLAARLSRLLTQNDGLVGSFEALHEKALGKARSKDTRETRSKENHGPRQMAARSAFVNARFKSSTLPPYA